MYRKKPPIIGITTYGRNAEGRFFLPGEYVDAVRLASGVPVLLTPGEKNIREIYRLVDGIIFAGGGDFAPAAYGGTPHSAIDRVDPERDRFEIELAKYACKQTKPVFGICRGIQLLNVITGGDLIQHLPDVIEGDYLHRTPEGQATEHKVELARDCRLAQITGKTQITVVSKHHQGLRRVSADWNIAGHAEDGIVEALEYQNHPWLIAVLWHPELSLNDPDQQKIFKAFVEACKKT